MLFMGEEYGEPNPFQYFTDHSDPVLVEGVREGRKREFAAFVSAGTDVPDPQDPQTFERSRLNHALRDRGRHRVLWTLYRELLRLRRELPALATGDMQSLDAQADPAQQSLWLRRRYRDEQVWVGLNFGETTAQLRLPNGRWQLLIDSAAPIWAEDAPAPEVPITPGDVLELTELTIAPHSFVLLRHVRPF
jgi:maltooligosyltrehalose trehalohydrolase